jgi:phosphoribosyl 1,2-cyclic phosphate phosphodiesterase
MLRTNYSTVDSVLITHEHNDHVAGLDDLRPYNFIKKGDIPVFTLERVGEELKKKYYYAFEEKKYPGSPGYDMRYIKHGDEWEWEGIHISAFEIMHGNLPILGFRFDDFVYITDAKFIPEKSMKYLENIECLVINALREQEHWSHLTMSEARDLVFGLKPKKAYFTHISHLLGEYEKIQNKLGGNQFFAFDGLKLKFN